MDQAATRVAAFMLEKRARGGGASAALAKAHTTGISAQTRGKGP